MTVKNGCYENVIALLSDDLMPAQEIANKLGITRQLSRKMLERAVSVGLAAKFFKNQHDARYSLAAKTEQNIDIKKDEKMLEDCGVKKINMPNVFELPELSGSYDTTG